MKVFVIFFISLLANKGNGALSPDPICANDLTQILQIICGENGFTRTLQKRPDVLALEGDVPYPYASPSLANIFGLEPGNLLVKARRMRTFGVVDECCTKSCTLNELASYCY